MTDPLTLKPMDEADLDWVMSVERRVYVRPWGRRGFELALDEGLNYVIVRGSGTHEQPVGYVICRPVVDEVELLNFCIAPPFQRQGLGRRALKILLERWVEQGWQRALLEVRVSNPARTLYRSLGFDEDGVRPNYYPGDRPGSEREDACLMSCDLSVH
ncbi:ribosomal protein S18-alanine N-acetyltransferase [Thiomicrospira sp. WB1]|uniref:ribosomal protein S18-alanine N-acetyltransferase n=1 Tax=Thiomicrospira sp. WB1 TaxID=1685380 RepID=UPI000746CAA1|nr:ribosomal protein S18-alanine N-acetyltransferase [Thiomicrospira sp. WB1]KUJ71431.1 hypothetical protein AVO41_07835 [Thiomicrospira sp. WB1]